MKASTSTFYELDDARFHVRRWGDPAASKIVMLHGWMDTSATFQFVVDALQGSWLVLAPDLRGYGLSSWRNDKYWFYDDVADLASLVEYLSAKEPVRLVGHSYGGAVASAYAGARSDRVARFVNLEGFGLEDRPASEEPQRVAQWLSALQKQPSSTSFAAPAEFAAHLRALNPRLSSNRAQFLAEHIAQPRSDGRVEFAADPWRRLRAGSLSFPSTEAFQASCAHVQAPTLWIRSTDSHYMKRVFAGDPEAYRARYSCLPDGHDAVVDDAGHNLHHDQPERVAALIEDFLS